MRAVLFRVRRILGRQWIGAVACTVVVAIVGTSMLMLLAGARRTGSTVDRYTDAAGGEIAGVIEQRSGMPRTDEIRQLSGVASVQAITFLFGLVGTPDGPEALTFAGEPLAGFILLDGRLPDASAPHEFVADEGFVRDSGARLGDTFPARFWSAGQAERGAAFLAEPEGPAFTATLVGVLSVPDVLNEAYRITIFPTSLLAEDVAPVGTNITVRLEPSLTLDDLRASTDTLDGGAGLGIGPGSIVSAEVRTAVHAQARGLWVMSAVAWVAGLVVVGQLLTRVNRPAAPEVAAMGALGQRRVEAGAETVLRAAVPVVAGSALAIVGAVAVSFRFPTGFVARLEPEPGRRFDLVAHFGGAFALSMALLAWVAVDWGLAQAPRGASARPRGVGGPLSVLPGVTVGLGARFALAGRGQSQRSAIPTLAGLTFTVVGLTATLTFGSGLVRLVTDPARYGSTFELGLGDLTGMTATELQATFEPDGDIDGLALLYEATARAGAETVDLVGFLPVRGDVAPPLLEGRLPRGPAEVAVGRLTADQLGVSIDDDLELAGKQADTFRVVGVVVVPSIGGGDGVGRGAVVTPEALGRLHAEVGTVLAAVTLNPSAPPGTAARLAGLVGVDVESSREIVTSPPSAIANVARVRGVPVALAWLLAALAVLALLHSLIVSIHGHRRDVAILRALGAGRSWVGRVIRWQATWLSMVPVLLGAPLGILVGSLVFRRFAEGVGAVPHPSVPWASLAILAGALIVTANVVATVPARRALRDAVTVSLRAD